jgi:hypothetical protein
MGLDKVTLGPEYLSILPVFRVGEDQLSLRDGVIFGEHRSEAIIRLLYQGLYSSADSARGDSDHHAWAKTAARALLNSHFSGSIRKIPAFASSVRPGSMLGASDVGSCPESPSTAKRAA